MSHSNSHAQAQPEARALSASFSTPPSTQGCLNFDIYERIIDFSLLSIPFANGNLSSGSSTYTKKDLSALKLLQSLCLVNSEFYHIAQKRLYAGVRYSEWMDVPGPRPPFPFYQTSGKCDDRAVARIQAPSWFRG